MGKNWENTGGQTSVAFSDNLITYDHPTPTGCSIAFCSIFLRVGGVTYISSWWFGTFFIFPYIGNNHAN
jgi:hypothetical protein